MKKLTNHIAQNNKKVVKESDLWCLPSNGKPISEEDFRAWLLEAEKGPFISLEEAKKRWAKEKAKIIKSIK